MKQASGCLMFRVFTGAVENSGRISLKQTQVSHMCGRTPFLSVFHFGNFILPSLTAVRDTED